MTVSTPIKIVALAALALALGLGGLLLVTGGHSSSSTVVVPPPSVPARPAHAAMHHHAAKPAVHRAPRIRLDTTLPSLVRQALLRHPVAVVAVFSTRSAGDAALLAAARTGAHTAHAGFVAANVAHEAIAAALATWSPSVSEPAVLVVRRPGTVVMTLGAPTDGVSVAQAAASAR